uniref:Histidine kinase/HSP90-like ATPase domain-containing protein n=1 Tax=Haptolina brevifila TaxID=156173 RepID=A0A7S2MDC2_9EUKA
MPELARRVRGGRSDDVCMQVEVDEAVTAGETFEFEAEVSKVMDIIINSLYSDKDIFLRELVSNASDACDKKRFLKLTDEKSGGYDGRIRIIGDKKTNTLTIEDNGVGMTRKELQTNLGRIAQSGTKKFTEALGSGADSSNLIGQFGVGFYSAFLVADKVTVITKAEDGPQLRWESVSANQYTISEDDSEPIETSGTRLVLTLKEDADKYIDDYTMRDMLKRYSEFISFPIELWAEKTEYDTVPDPDAEVKEGEEPPTKTVPRTTNVWEKVNVAKPLWMRDPKEINDEEYSEFYKTTFKAYDDPAAHVHFSLEGQVEFRAMLFCPSSVPWELSQDMFNDKVKPMKLFVKRVFISDQFDESLLPRWLSFLKGMVDSEDLPLNVSRELLQKSRVLSIISKRLVRKALDMFKDIAKDEEKFEKFSNNFGRYIKVGVIEDKDNKDKLLDLATFVSSTQDKVTTLPAYVSRMKEGQKQIYYLSGASKAAANASPVLEGLRNKGYEVILALDQIDEIALQGIGKFKDFDVIDASKENADLGDLSEEEKGEAESAKEELKAAMEYLKTTLGARVDKVDVSSRLTSSPSALVQPQWGMSPQMMKFMKAQAAAAGTDDAMMGGMASNLEINPKHPVIAKLKEMVGEGGDGVDAAAAGYAELIYDVAAVSSGYELSDPSSFAKRVVALMDGGVEALAMEGTAVEGGKSMAEWAMKGDVVEEESATVIETPEEEENEEDKPITPEVV